MTTDQTPNSAARLNAAVSIVQAYVCNHVLRPNELIALIEAVYTTLEGLNGKMSAAPAAPVPAVPIKKSVFPDHLICLEDGRKFRSLKRHLGSVYGLTPDEYRARWGLPHDYPMVAPNYSAVRSKLAKEIGLGRSMQAGGAVAPKVVQEGKAPANEDAKRPMRRARA